MIIEKIYATHAINCSELCGSQSSVSVLLPYRFLFFHYLHRTLVNLSNSMKNGWQFLLSTIGIDITTSLRTRARLLFPQRSEWRRRPYNTNVKDVRWYRSRYEGRRSRLKSKKPRGARLGFLSRCRWIDI